MAFADPLDKDAIAAAKQAFNEDIRPAIAPPENIQAAIEQVRRGFAAGYQAAMREDSVVGIVGAIITAAVEVNASDIHLEPLKDRLRVRFRQDGILVKHKDLPRELIPSLTSRIKVMCEVDITEKRRHQGGRMLFERSGMKLDLRASFYVTIHGEKIVLRLLNRKNELIVIGEIRDNFSADIAVQAALTGHKVLTTFHTEDSIGGLVRLLNMNIEAFLVSSTVVSVLAQRLLRKVCAACAVPVSPSPGDLQRSGYSPSSVAGAGFKMGSGCGECGYTGYKGRVGIFELLVLDEMVLNAVLEQRTSFEIRSICIESSGLVTLLEDGIVKAADGITTLEEMLRCLPRLHAPRPRGELRRCLGA